MKHHKRTAMVAARAGLRTVQAAGWRLLVILAPLAVNLWGQQPFALPKVVAVRTLVWVLAGLALAEFVLAHPASRRQARPNPLLVPVALLALVLLLTTATAANVRLSVWGSYQRGQGVVALLTYLLLCLLAAGRFRSPHRARSLVTVMAAASVPVLVLGLAQAAGWDPLGLVSDARSPVYATLGRSNFVGAYLALLAPLTLALLVTAADRREWALWVLLLAGQLLVIGLAWARGAWLATAAGLLVFSLLWRHAKMPGTCRDCRSRCAGHLAWGRLALLRHLGWLAAGIVALAGPLLVLWQGQRQTGSAAARLAIWRATLGLVGERPVLGYGADALAAVFAEVYPPELVYYQGRAFFVDRAHNLLLDWAAVAGLPGLVALGLVLVQFGVVVVQALRRLEGRVAPLRRALLAAVAAAVVANLANNLVSFDVTATATAFWLVLGMGVALAMPALGREPVRPLAAAGRAGLARTWHAGALQLGRWALVALIVAAVVLASTQFNLRPLLADVASREAARSAAAGRWAAATAAGERAVWLWPAEPTYHRQLSQACWQRALAEPGRAGLWIGRAEATLGRARVLRPRSPDIWLETALLHQATNRLTGRDARAEVARAFGRALALAPGRATLHAAVGRAYLEDGDLEQAVRYLGQAVALDASNEPVYYDLAAAWLARGRPERALDVYYQAARALPESSQALAGLARSYLRMGLPGRALPWAEKALLLDPENAQALAVRAAIVGE